MCQQNFCNNAKFKCGERCKPQKRGNNRVSKVSCNIGILKSIISGFSRLFCGLIICRIKQFLTMLIIFFSRNMGGKLGHEVRLNLKIEKMSELAKYAMSELQGRFGDKTG